LSARSKYVNFESLPNEGGILPVNLFTFNALGRENKELYDKVTGEIFGMG
jgi:hypothetical protein